MDAQDYKASSGTHQIIYHSAASHDFQIKKKNFSLKNRDIWPIATIGLIKKIYSKFRNVFKFRMKE